MSNLSDWVVVFDLDDTLWGGTIAEDNIKDIKLGNMNPEGEAFQNFQELLKNVKYFHPNPIQSHVFVACHVCANRGSTRCRIGKAATK